MKRVICFILSCLMITSTISILAFAKDGEPEGAVEAEATFELAYGGANGIFSMTFDDGDLATTRWLIEMFEKYDLYGSTMNIPSLHPNVSHVVALCGFVSVEEMIKTFFQGPMKGYRKAVLALEQTSNPHFVSFNALKSLSNTQTKALLIYSEDDRLCRRVHYDILHEGLKDQPNVTLMLVKNKGHNPNYTEDAVKLLGVFGKARAKFAKKKNASPEEKAKFVASFDWNAMTAQDDAVWQAILAHLDHQ